MEPTIEILISSPLSGSEATALRDLVTGLRTPALILANFEVPSRGASHQIDFVVITEKRAELIELKNITAPVRGGVNGPWQIETSPGSFVPYSRPNPWEQARDAKLALSDAMHGFAKQRSDVPKPAKRRYFEQFDASVTFYPVLMPGSAVCAGNYKAWVRSFPDTLQCLNSRPLPVQSTWEIRDWRTFAIDYLGLTPASLLQAIDADVFRAHQSLLDYSARLLRRDIAALLPARGQELVGQNVIDKLKGPADVLLLGRSGLGKSFHLEHYCRVCFEFDEVPILLHVRHYQRDLNRAIHKSIGQYTRLTPAELLDTAKRLGKHPVLIVDGWNDCPGQMHTDLGDDVAAFKLRYYAKLVTASQTMPSHHLFATGTRVELDPLRPGHKQAISAFYARRPGESVPARWLEPFSTAFDLKIAGLCQADRAIAKTRAELYESYIRSAVPSVSARAVLRKLAWHMGENFKPALPLAEYEGTVEKFVQELGLPLSVADELLRSPVLALDRDVVTFEHELLRDYFRAEHLLRETEAEHLAAKLEEPKYIELAEFVLPSLANESVVRELLFRSGLELLIEAFRGSLGTTAMHMIRNECERLLTQCRDRLSDINVEPSITERGDGRRFVWGAYVVGSTCMSDADVKPWAVIANNLGDDMVKSAFLELLDVGEWALKEASERIGRERRIKPTAIFGELVHHNVIMNHPRPAHPLLFVCHQVRQIRMLGSRHSDVLPIREVLLTKVREGAAGALALLLLMFDLHSTESIHLADVLAIARQAWDTRLPTLQMEALDFIHSNAHAIREAGQEAGTPIIGLLETFEVRDNIFLSTQWLETRSAFSGFETGIDMGSALAEFRRILSTAAAGDDPAYQLYRQTEPSLTFDQFVAGWASGALGKIFEDVFQGVYYDAYESLSEDEKRKLLILALQKPSIGFFTDWYLAELCKSGCEGAEDILVRIGSRIDPDSFCPQDCVKCFIIAHEAWARIADQPIPYRDVSSDDHRVWAIVGELIFWLNRKDKDSSGRMSFLLGELTRFPKAVPDVLKQIGHSQMGMGPAPALQLLLAQHTQGIRNALHESLKWEGCLSSAFRNPPLHSTELFLWTISTLGYIGNRESVSLLRPWTEITAYGKEAIRAIEHIERREIASRGQETVAPN
jgi:hypothetical protein